MPFSSVFPPDKLVLLLFVFFLSNLVNNIRNDTGMENVLAEGGHKRTTLNRDQWIRTAAQLITAIHRGIQRTHNKLGDINFLVQDNIGPDDSNAVRQMTNAVGALNAYLAYFSDPIADNLPTGSNVPAASWYRVN
jgi:hypothetical protein